MNLVVGNCSWNQLLLVSTSCCWFQPTGETKQRVTKPQTTGQTHQSAREDQKRKIFQVSLTSDLCEPNVQSHRVSPVSPPPLGPPDRRPRDVQRHPEGLGRLPATGGPGLTAAPAALAVVLQPLLLTGRLVASQAAAMDLTKSICTKKEKKRNEKIISFFSVKAVVLFLPPPPDLFLTFVLLLFFYYFEALFFDGFCVFISFSLFISSFVLNR